MNKWIAGAALLSSVLTVAHIFGGTPQFPTPVVQADLDADIRAAASVVWHAVSLLLIFDSAVLIRVAMGRGRAGAGVVAAHYMGFVALFIYFGVSQLGNVTDLPQWIIFAAILAMLWMGMRAAARANGTGARPLA